VIMGSLDGATSPARTFTPIVGAQLRVEGELVLPLRPDFEYAVLILDGAATVDGTRLPPGPLLYLGVGRDRLTVSGHGRTLLLGGEPFAERIVMWWNFVGARADWEAGRERFGVVHGYAGDPLRAPAMPATRLVPRGRKPHP
jgi:quercetin 2,3-dioxygenase